MADKSCGKRNYKPNISRKFNRQPSKEHTLRKRQPPKHSRDKNVIYVSSKSNTKSLLEHCSKLILEGDEKEITIYCLGAAIQRGILLALQICEKHPSFLHQVNTLTTELIDDLEPATDEADYEIQKRNNSALKIRVFCSNSQEKETVENKS